MCDQTVLSRICDQIVLSHIYVTKLCCHTLGSSECTQCPLLWILSQSYNCGYWSWQWGAEPTSTEHRMCVGEWGFANAESGITLRSARIRARSAWRMIDSLDHVQSRDRRTKGRNMKWRVAAVAAVSWIDYLTKSTETLGYHSWAAPLTELTTLSLFLSIWIEIINKDDKDEGSRH